jgi:hypothetical protein
MNRDPYRESNGWWVVVILVVLVFAGLVYACAPVHAHDWFTGTHDPKTGFSCCGGTDCAILPDEAVRAVPGGYVIEMLPPGFPNGNTISTPFTIPNERAAPGKDAAHYALCIWGKQYQCFFTPWPAY